MIATVGYEVMNVGSPKAYEIFEVRSESNPNKIYRVDMTNMRCSCPGWTMHGHRKPCKHIRQIAAERGISL